MTFEHVLVVGAGQMGGGIAQVVAASGRRVSLHDPYPGRGRARARRRCGGASSGSPRRAAPTRTRRSRASTPVDELVAADLMIEAVVEDAAVKEDVFRRADARAARRRDPRLEHELDPDRVARRGRRGGPTA